MVGRVYLTGCLSGRRCTVDSNRLRACIRFRLSRPPLRPPPIGLKRRSAHSAKLVPACILVSAASALLRLPGDDPALRRAALGLHPRPTKAAELVLELVGLSAGPALHGTLTPAATLTPPA